MFSDQRVVAVVIVFLLSGCDAAKNLGRSPEERINEARPVPAAVVEARQSVEATLAEDAAAIADLQGELAARDKVRALTCAKAFSPSLFQSKESVAKSLTDQKCFDDYDRQTVEWLKGRKLHALLSAGPLRAVPSTPAAIFATVGGINKIEFAADAPVAAYTSNNMVEIVDVGSGTSIFLDRKLSQHPHSVSLSPNGRVFAVGGVSGMSLRDAESGEVLRDLPDHQRFTFLDSETGIASKRDRGAVELIDLANDGRVVTVRGIDMAPTRILTPPGAQGEFLLASHQSLLRYALKRDADGVEAVLLDQKGNASMSWSDNTGDATVDGAWYVHAAADDFSVTNLQTLETEKMTLAPFRARGATPMPNPDEMLVLGNLSSVPRSLIYSISNRTFAPVEDEQLQATSRYSGLRTVFIPALQRVAVVSGTNVKMLDHVKRGPRYGIEALARILAEEQRIELQNRAAAVAAREGYKLDRIVNGVPVASSPLLAAANDAQIEAVGVYQSASGSRGAGKPSVAGVVTVALRPSAKPILLVLSSYDPVSWRLMGARAAKLKAVLLSGYSPSTVSGEEGVQVINIGNHYAYEHGGSGFGALQREVTKRTGKSIDTFQGKYSGTTFIVGGR